MLRPEDVLQECTFRRHGNSRQTKQQKLPDFLLKEIDGHNFRQIEDALTTVPFESGKPSFLIYHTVKGKKALIMDMLVGTGLDCLGPLQENAGVDLSLSKNRYDKVAVMGSVDVDLLVGVRPQR